MDLFLNEFPSHEVQIQSPIIGILCMDVSSELFKVYGSSVNSYIAASYVKFLQYAGAHVVPIWIAKDERYYRDIMSKINGILIPGGAVFFNSAHIQRPEQTNYCVQSAEIIYRIASEMNDDGNYFPLWGTCLGYQLLLYHSAGGKEIRQDCTKLDKSMPLELEKDLKNSKMFQDLPKDMETLLQREPFAVHFHRYCITKNDLHLFGIADLWRVTSVNQDDKGLCFISTIEHTKYPFYGVQFHPERVDFELSNNADVFHTEDSKKCAQYFANFFVSECRRNTNHFSDEKEAGRHLISKFEITSNKDTKSRDYYLFNEQSDYPQLESVVNSK